MFVDPTMRRPAQEHSPVRVVDATVPVRRFQMMSVGPDMPGGWTCRSPTFALSPRTFPYRKPERV